MFISKYGKRYCCFRCGCLFYDLNREKAICPRCDADQAEAPEFEAKSMPKPRRKEPPRKMLDEDMVLSEDVAEEEEEFDSDVVSLEEELGDIDIDEE